MQRNVALWIGLFIVALLVVTAIFGPWWVGDAGLLPIDLELDLASPAKAGRLGRGENGVDVFTSLVHGARVSLLVSFGSVSISLSLGLFYGATAGFLGGRIDALAMRVVDVLLAFPGILLAIYVAAVLPPSLFNVVLALSATGWVGYARLTRAQVLEVKGREYITAAFALGASSPRILLNHILPNILGPILIQASFGLSTAVLAEASLSFLGIGVPPGTPSWGALLDEGVAHLFVAPHLVVFPGLCIAVCVLGFNFLGDGLRDLLDSKS
ncbi:MAG: ABC transporter permease [Deltaproteobacteria bacterium]|nr:ABC transporter permease [Deltaproteobacteria bacterium]